MSDPKVNISIDSMSVFAPVISASLVGAYYSALLVKQGKGLEISRELETKALQEVVAQWLNLQGIISESLLKVLKEKNPG